jgi:hypothetical protein
LPRVKLLGYEAACSHPPSAKVKHEHEWSHNSTSPYAFMTYLYLSFIFPGGFVNVCPAITAVYMCSMFCGVYKKAI